MLGLTAAVTVMPMRRPITIAVTAMGLAGAVAPAALAAYPTGENGRIALGVQGEGIVTLSPNGSGRRVIGDPSAEERQPALSPDGRRFIYLRSPNSDPNAVDIWEINVDGSANRPLFANPTIGEEGPSISPDGRRIAFWSQDQRDIFVGNANGSGLVNITAGHAGFVDQEEPDWSPDGRRIVFVARTQPVAALYTMRPDGTDVQEVFAPPEGGITAPRYTPNGRKLLFSHGVNPTGEDIWSIFPDGSGLRNLTADLPGDANYPVPSPDGNSIVFSNAQASFETWLMSINGTGRRCITCNTPVQESPPYSWETIYECGGDRARLIGDDSTDAIRGTRKSDVIVGNGGKDRILGRGGDDQICGGRGRDKLLGGSGSDDLFGLQGADVLIGGGGKDSTKGGKGKDKEKP